MESAAYVFYGILRLLRKVKHFINFKEDADGVLSRFLLR